MVAISLKLPDELVHASGKNAKALQLTRAEYIRRAIEQMNRKTDAALKARRLVAASLKVRGESMRVNAEFDAIEKDVERAHTDEDVRLVRSAPSRTSPAT